MVDKPSVTSQTYVKFGDKKSVICHIGNLDDCLEPNNENFAGNMYGIMYDSLVSIIHGEDVSKIKDIYAYVGEDENLTNAIVYVITDGTFDKTVYYIPGSQEVVKATFLLKEQEGEYVIKYMEGEDTTKHISSITYKQRTALGEMIQVLTVDNSEPIITSKLGTTTITNTEENTAAIMGVYNTFTHAEGGFIDLGDEGNIFAWSDNGKIYARIINIRIGETTEMVYTDSQTNEFLIVLN